ncbi:Putative helicase, P-loop containing nucleoside triphosphate hydrolase, SNF2-like domain superfamily [Colletotrichum destructivum]|uniref:Helicase, P-loop containing nucleoside triphosphate hydrolase, SNF2-like domain superfamily n=1 Tax=Colletotrichum destructivum TaxID=34406 RepID=A0AAX4IY67_9PEZI|nr:Putative helicase, P-loop containing nucleoside triphosphate hydrolase, SNF2-like domain superfamily [Colletotrichum destructivum]
MIPGIKARCDQRSISETTSTFPIQIKTGSKFEATDGSGIKGLIASEFGQSQMIQELLDDDLLRLFTMCTVSETSDTRKANQRFIQMHCNLEITVYGPFSEFEEIGNWFQEYDVYLQDPVHCHLDAPYANPHKLSSNDLTWCPMVWQVVSQSSDQVFLKDITDRIDMLDMLNSRSDLEEANQPTVIATELKRHQKQALTFMLRRERGWGFQDGQSDIWGVVDTTQRRSFVNFVSESYQNEEPPQFYGGIVADPMGLGKTLTMIALVATDLEDQKPVVDTGAIAEGKHFSGATLIIIPPPLIGSWEEQLFDHVVTGGLRCRRHHGKTRLTDLRDLDGVNVVLTTYHTVSAEWKDGKDEENSALFGVCWRRIILDEAHYIRNEHSRMARAVCALDSISRWAVTGTPIQNRLSDLATIVKFIGAYPYTDTRQFEADLSRLWKSGQDEKAVQRLKYLSACLILRRSKGTITLPPRHDKLCAVDFTSEERAAYEEMRQQAITRIEEALQQDSGFETANVAVYHNILQRIESLRLFCNLGLGYHSRHSKKISSSDDHNWAEIAQQLFNLQMQKEPVVCLGCSSTLELTETILDEYIETKPRAQFFQCMKFACGHCSRRLGRANRSMTCGHKPSCPTAPVSFNNRALEEIPDSVPRGRNWSFGMPSKVKALVADIKRLSPEVKCIVFSTWRMTLDVVEEALKHAGKTTVRFDGSVSQKDRHSVVERFRKDPGVSVMLLTLSCGAVGLTLTVASRVYLMEPHWNPNLEEQALARVHRMGQTREVTTMRLYMRDSFEEQVMEVQKTKKQLAGLLLSPHDGSQTDDSLSGLQKLRSLL